MLPYAAIAFGNKYLNTFMLSFVKVIVGHLGCLCIAMYSCVLLLYFLENNK